MNKSKKTIKGPVKSKKTTKPLNRNIWLIPSIILGILLIGALLFDKFYERVLVTIDDEKYRLSDMRYNFYTVETDNQMFLSYFGDSYWDMAADEAGTYTNGDIAKTEAISTLIYTEIMYKHAIEENFTLTEEDLSEIATDLATIKENMPAEAVKKNGFTDDFLTKTLDKAKLVENYRQSIIDSLDIDDAAITESVVYEDYRQYDIEYLYVSNKKTDESGTTVDLSAEEITAAKEKLQAKKAAAASNEDWSTLVPENETEISYSEKSFTPIGTSIPEDLKSQLIGMENGAISEVLETSNGYYLVKMINNNNDKAYNDEIKAAINRAESSAFESYYAEKIAPEHNVKLHDRAIRNLNIGSLTIPE